MEPKITKNIISYFDKEKYPHCVHDSAESENQWARKETRLCRDCKILKPRSCFGYNTSSSCPFDKSGNLLRRPECIECTKLASLTKRDAIKNAKERGIPIKAPEGTMCQICLKTEDIVFDHSHIQCDFRGWLCNSCNRSIGVLGDEPEDLVKSFVYTCRGDKEKARYILESYLKTINTII